ncbi:MAG TPA: Eco57I restriction-modification methylase domain-containing protein, partial [Desulfobacterales bacterium]|nr:Eco57I restriction-modification methylase domain-containing protein [Desulfobacterales bacterium]
EVVAYENDSLALSYLSETLRRCETACDRAGIRFYGEIREEDFVASGLALVEKGLFTEQAERFTHVILNPPYKKINAQSETRKILDTLGMEVTNLYAAFVWLAAKLLDPKGELVAITPRSFCNGPYFRRFRLALLDMMALQQIHVFASRKKVFGDDNVLQENVIFHATRNQCKPNRVAISSSKGVDFSNASIRHVLYEHVVLPRDRDSFIHLLLSDEDDETIEMIQRFDASLSDLGIEVSTGRVVDFRARNYLMYRPEKNTAPLIYPCHFENGFVNWPGKTAKKPNAILSVEQTRDLMVVAGDYVLTKRFSSKEERRRVVAAIYDPSKIKASLVGFENHLNYFHTKAKGLSPNLARGLAMYLNSSLFDKYFRLFSGHTQVNATDLRKMRYPSREQLMNLGMHVKDRMPNQETIDAALKRVMDGQTCNKHKRTFRSP